MALFRFTAVDVAGKKVKGEVEAPDERSLVKTLQQEELIPIKIKKTEEGGKLKLPIIPTIGGGVALSEISGFTRQLATMISAGLPITDALSILQRQTKNKNFARILGNIVAEVEGGMSLAGSFGKFPNVFDPVYINLIEAGETGGVLDKVLSKLAQTLEKEREFKAKTRGAFIYPVIVISVMIIVVAIMMIFVIPKMTGLYSEIGADLPLPTKILIAASDFMRGFWWLMILSFTGALYGLRVFAKTEKGAQVVSRAILRIPIWGKIRKTLILAQFTRTLGLLIGTGVPIIAALKVVAGILTSSAYKEGIDLAIRRVERGSPLYQPLTVNPVFPPIISQMIRVGEETGKMDEVLGRLSIYFEGESENLIRNLTTALEPVILVILGVGVGVLVLSIILPIYNLTAQF